mgnify:CR=1 FL=1
MAAHPAVEVLDALLELVGPADADGVRYGTGQLAGVRVFDGPSLADLEDVDVLALGLGVDAVNAGLGQTRPETFELTGLAQNVSGDVDQAARRARAFVLFDALRSLLVADPTVGGRCMRAYLARWAYRPEQGPAGSSAVVTFAIRVDARRFEGD